MKKLIKPLLFVSVISSLVGAAQAQVADYEWLRGAQLNPVLAPTLATKDASFYVMNPEIGMKQTFVITRAASCVDSRWKPGVQFCTVGLRDVSFVSNVQVVGANNQSITNVSFAPYIQMHYSQHTSGNVAMNVSEVAVSSLQQIYS